MSEHNPTSSWMDMIPPKTLFLGGLVGGILVLCTIGFFILLGMKLSGGGSDYYPSPVAAGGEQPAPQPGEPAVGKPAAVTNDDHVLGASGAKVTLFMYSDFQCPFCDRFHPTAEKLAADYKGKIKLVFRHFPLDSIHPQATPAASASECVASLKGNEAFWKYGALLFKNQSSLSDATYSNLAAQVGVNKGAFESCYKSNKFVAKVKAQQAEGEKIGVQGTPATFVVARDGSVELIGGALPYEQAKTYIERALAK